MLGRAAHLEQQFVENDPGFRGAIGVGLIIWGNIKQPASINQDSASPQTTSFSAQFRQSVREPSEPGRFPRGVVFQDLQKEQKV